MKYLTIAVILLLFIGLAGAQEQGPENVSILQVKENTCETKAIAHYIESTDINQAGKQDWNIKTAQSYQELATMGYQEC